MLAGPAPAGAAIAAALGAIGLYAVAVAGFKWLPLYDCVVLPPLLALVFRALDPFDRRARTRVLVGAGALLVAAFLLRLWTLGYEGRNAVFGGILPWSDSGDFYSDALRLIHGRRFSPASSRRPLFPALLAALLKLCGGDLRLPLAILGAVGAVTMALPALEVWRTDGWKSALAVYLVFVFFERRWTGFIQTEHLGLPLGAVGFALLWRAQSLRRVDARSAVGAAALGVFALALGLFARAGCFLVLPALVIWGAGLAPSARGRIHAGAALVGAVLIAFCIHESTLATAGNGTSFSDYPPIFYGLLHGEDFTYLAQTHRWLGELAPPDRVSAQWAVIVDEIRVRPWILPLALARSLSAFFVSPFGAFSYVWTNPDDAIFEDGPRIDSLWQSAGPLGILRYWRSTLGTFSIVNAAVMGALGAALVVAFLIGAFKLARDRDPQRSLLAAATVGILASVPFMPPWITSGVQIQTVTLGFAAALPASLLSARSATGVQRAPPPFPRAIALSLPVAIAAFAALLGWVLLVPRLPPAAAPSGLRWVDVAPASSVEVAPRRALSFRRKGLADLAASLEFLSKHNDDLTGSVAPSMNVGVLFHSAYDPAAGHWEILVDDARRLDGRSGWIAIASRPLRSPRVQLLVEPPRPAVAGRR